VAANLADLTTNDPEKQKQEQSGGVTVDNSSAEMHTTIFSICESPKNPNLIWVGTDDGNVQLTRDGGQTWTNVAGNVPSLPKNAWVSSIEADTLTKTRRTRRLTCTHSATCDPTCTRQQTLGAPGRRLSRRRASCAATRTW